MQVNGALDGALGRSNGAFGAKDGALPDTPERAILALVAAHPGINRKMFAEQTEIPPRSLDRAIAAMARKGTIERLGGKRTGGYHLK